MSRAPRKALLGALALSSSLGFASPARGDEPKGRTSSLSWVRLDGAETCIGTQELAQRVEKRLKRKVFVSASEADVSVEGHVERSGPSSWHAVFTIRGANGELLGTRELDSHETDCSAFSEGLAFVVSVLIDPDAESAPPEETETPKPKPAPKPKPRVVIRRERVLVPVPVSKEPSLRLEAGAAATLAFGILPGAAFGVTPSVVLEPRHFWGVLLTGTYFLGKSVEAEQGARSDLGLAYGGAALCPFGVRSGKISDRACLGVLGGVLESQGVGFTQEETSQKPFVAGFLPNRFAVRLAGPFALTATLTLLVPLTRAELSYATADGTSHSLYKPAPLALSGDIGVGVFVP